MANVWDKQPWETELQFHYFKQYYLNQKGQRTVKKAYRDYMMLENKVAKEDLKNNLPGYWQNMSRGKGSRGEDIPGSMSWAQRASAYDYQETAKRNEVRRELMEATKQKQFDDYETLLETWQILSETLRDKLLKERNNERFDPRIYMKDFKTLAETRIEIAKFVEATVGDFVESNDTVTISFEEGQEETDESTE